MKKRNNKKKSTDLLKGNFVLMNMMSNLEEDFDEEEAATIAAAIMCGLANAPYLVELWEHMYETVMEVGDEPDDEEFFFGKNGLGGDWTS